MQYVDFVSSFHKIIKRDYLGRVNDPEFPKYKAAELANGSMIIGMGIGELIIGGYNYMPGRWDNFINNLKLLLIRV